MDVLLKNIEQHDQQTNNSKNINDLSNHHRNIQALLTEVFKMRRRKEGACDGKKNNLLVWPGNFQLLLSSALVPSARKPQGNEFFKTI